MDSLDAFLDDLARELANDPEVLREVEEFQGFLEIRGAGRETA